MIRAGSDAALCQIPLTTCLDCHKYRQVQSKCITVYDHEWCYFYVTVALVRHYREHFIRSGTAIVTVCGPESGKLL